MTKLANFDSLKKLFLVSMLALLCLLAVGADPGDTKPKETCSCGPTTEGEGGVSLLFDPKALNADLGATVNPNARLKDDKTGGAVNATFEVNYPDLKTGGYKYIISPTLSASSGTSTQLTIVLKTYDQLDKEGKRAVWNYFGLMLDRDGHEYWFPSFTESFWAQMQMPFCAIDETVFVTGTATDGKGWSKAAFVVTVPGSGVEKALTGKMPPDL